MIDFHTHILPNIDDGAASVEEAVQLLELLKRQGVERVAFTPHYLGRSRSVETFLQQRAQAFERIRSSLPAGMEVRLGAEVYVGEHLLFSADDLVRLTLGESKYLLAELPYEGMWGRGVFESLDRIRSIGLRPVIAHIARYDAVRRCPELAAQLISQGCLIQTNTDAFLSRQRPLVNRLLERGQIHCLGTDAHNLETRPPCYDRACRAIRETFGEAVLDALAEQMERIWNNERITPKLTKPVKRFFGRYL